MLPKKLSQKQMTLSEAIKRLEDAGVDNPAYDARELFYHIGKVEKPIFLNTVCTSQELDRAIERRAEREPLQYIIGNVGFYNEEYAVTPDCLIPRSDTEILVDLVVKRLPKGEKMLDLCTGSGCIAISSVANTDSTSAVAVDISEGALTIAKKNAKNNGVFERVRFIQGDCLGTLPNDVTSDKYFCLTSNPPYIREEVYSGLEKELFHEPRIALVASDHGLQFYRALVPLGIKLVKRGGFIAFEIGFDQGEDLVKIASEHGLECEIIKDYSGNDRVALINIK